MSEGMYTYIKTKNMHKTRGKVVNGVISACNTVHNCIIVKAYQKSAIIKSHIPYTNGTSKRVFVRKL